jgi:hypothetical protein
MFNIIENAKNKHMPSKTVKFNKHKHKKTKWITKGIIKSVHHRDGLYKKLKMTSPESVEYEAMQTNLKSYNGIIRKSIRNLKKSYYETCFNKYKDDIRNTWKTINDILNKTKKKRTFPEYFNDEEGIITDKLEIANKFNTFFTNIGLNLANKIKMPDNTNFKDYLKEKYTAEFNFQDIDREGVEKIINNMKPKTSCGFDGISMKIVKTAKDVLLEPLTMIINQMLNTVIFPEKLKIAKVNPIYKKEDKTLFTNYRPISLLPTISKIFERVIFNQLYTFFQKQKLFYSSQYGFRTEHSTEFAALEVVDILMERMDKNETPINIYLDLSKAFDTLDHNILTNKLHYYGIKGTALELFKNYLTKRTVC